jgi:5-methylphenazine-1-carboxylate 1-monooxygenase
MLERVAILLHIAALSMASSMNTPLNIAIAGGGIGGLTAALALVAQGHHVTVFEAAREIKALGVGINVLPHAVAVLSELGLRDALAATAVETEALVFANKFGQTIYRDARGLAGGYSHPQYSIHRGALHMALLNALHNKISPQQLRTGSRITGFRNHENHVVLNVQESGELQSEFVADILIAADGIHSATRAQLYPDEGGPKWNGMMMWRGTTRAPSFMGARTMVQAGNKFAKFVVYPIEKPDEKSGLQLINWICDIRVADGIGGTLTAPSRESWSTPGKVDDLLPTFGAWRFDWLDVSSMITNATQIFEWPMVDRDPLPRWTHERVTLLGDAAHPMYPIGSNGATQAILDARAIADAFADASDPRIALQRYELQRRPMTTDIVRMNRKEGLDIILDMVDERAPNGFNVLSDVIDPAEIAAVVRRYKSAAGHKSASQNSA